MKRILAYAVVAMICGCGGSNAPVLAPVTGTVSYQSKPVSDATVTMVSEKGQLSTGFTDKDGKFKMSTGNLPGVPLGKVKVGIVKMESAGAADMKSMKVEDMRNMQKAAKSTQKNAKDSAPKSEIPAKYADPQKSDLESTVDRSGSKNVFEYKLVDK